VLIGLTKRHKEPTGDEEGERSGILRRGQHHIQLLGSKYHPLHVRVGILRLEAERPRVVRLRRYFPDLAQILLIRPPSSARVDGHVACYVHAKAQAGEDLLVGQAQQFLFHLVDLVADRVAERVAERLLGVTA
jgi:hypothetical protein